MINANTPSSLTYINEEGVRLGTGAITKTFSDSYLYNLKTDMYEKDIINLIMKGEEINKNDESFKNIEYDVARRQVTNALVTVLKSQNVKIMSSPTRIVDALAVFMAKDLKAPGQPSKVFIYNDYIQHNSQNSDYKINNMRVDGLIARLFNAMIQIIYYGDPKKIIMNTKIVENSTGVFACLFTDCIDRISRISNIGTHRQKCMYLSSIYFLNNVLRKEINQTVRSYALKISGLTQKEAELLELQSKDNIYDNINTFVNGLADVLRLSGLKLDVVLNQWCWIYGASTYFGMELFTSLAGMISDSYIAYGINNSKTIQANGKEYYQRFMDAMMLLSNEVVR